MMTEKDVERIFESRSEDIAKRASELVTDSNPYAPIDYDKLATVLAPKVAPLVAKINRDSDDQALGRELRGEAKRAARIIVRKLVYAVMLALSIFVAWVTGIIAWLTAKF